MALTPEEQAELEQLKQELEGQDSPAISLAPQEDPNESTQGRVTGMLKGVAEGALSPFAMAGDLATRGVMGAFDAFGVERGEPMYPSQILKTSLDNFRSDYPSSEASRNTGNIAGGLAGALAIPSAVPRMTAAAEALPLIPKALAIGGVAATEGAVMGAAANAAGGDMLQGATTGALLGAGTGMATTGLASAANDLNNSGLRKYLFGSPESSRAVQAARGDDYIGPPLGVGSKNIDSQIELAKDLREHAATFDRTNPVKDIQVIPGREKEAFKQFQDNLIAIEASGISTRNNMLPAIAKAENEAMQAAQASGAPYKAGVSIDEIPLIKQTEKGAYGLQQMYDRAGPEGKVGIERAKQFVDSKFGIVPTKPYGESGPVIMGEARPLSIAELNQVRKEIDGHIAEVGGYDFMQPANASKNPSAENAYANTLSFYRQQIDQVVKQKIAGLLGEDAAKTFTEAGQNISMAKDVAPQADKFLLGTSQALTTKNPTQIAKTGSVVGNLGKVDQTIDYLLPGTGEAKLQDKGFAMPGEAISRLQRLVDIRNNNFVDPLARDWNIIKSKSQQLTTVGILATQMGLLQAPEELSAMPDMQAKEVVKTVAMTAPQLFAPTQDKVNTFEGKYLNPIEKDAMVSQALDSDPLTRAKVIGSSFENKYEPLTQPLAPAQKAQPSVPSIESLNSLLPSATPSIAPQISDAENNIRRLEEMTAIHARDVQ